jgi:hypothetical protein
MFLIKKKKSIFFPLTEVYLMMYAGMENGKEK